MQGVEISHLNASIKAVLKGYYDFMNSTIVDALRPCVYGKKDTIGMDSGPEITICNELRRYDAGAVIITEEIGKFESVINDTFRPNDPQTFRTLFISDPTDRSNQLKEFLTDCQDDIQIGELLKRADSVEKWEKKHGSPACITGSTSSITCIRRGIPIFSVIVNYITHEMTISCAAGNRIVKLPDKRVRGIDLDYVLRNGTTLVFPHIDGDEKNMDRFVTFLGDVGKAGYRENFLASGIMTETEMNTNLHYGKPGGPSRALYLSALQSKNTPIGFILANGEKLGEWVHWLTFMQYAYSQRDDSEPALTLYEVTQKQPMMKDGVLMSTPMNYSIFREYKGQIYIDTNKLLQMDNPSKYRSTLILAPNDNRWAVRVSSQAKYRQIRFNP